MGEIDSTARSRLPCELAGIETGVEDVIRDLVALPLEQE